ncbi:hypothetical protein ABW19_dt0207671 [Dactylella cylindrospora]|nr:hypothetical protein ABW19_dt0207671 [Dactylella cylindrospora]
MPLIRWLLNVEPLWNTPEEFTATLNRLPPSIHPHILKFFHLSDRKLSLASQLLQHLLISKHRSIPFPSVSITRNHAGITGGRPVYPGDPTLGTQGLEYNVSHHGCVIAIVSRLDAPKDLEDGNVGGGIGVDILEYEVRPKYVEGNMEAVMGWAEGFEEGEVFTAREMRGVRKAVAEVEIGGGYKAGQEIEEEKMKAVVRGLHVNWTLKEAYVKAVGTGLVTDLTAVEFDVAGIAGRLEKGRTSEVVVWLGKGLERRKGEEWYFEVEKVRVPGVEGVEGGYCVAIATKAEGLEEEEKKGEWVWLDWERDVMPFIEA